ncbi:hypothetical protein U1Q18_051716 [Sarracenia purpurea var. burkii]
MALPSLYRAYLRQLTRDTFSCFREVYVGLLSAVLYEYSSFATAVFLTHERFNVDVFSTRLDEDVVSIIRATKQKDFCGATVKYLSQSFQQRFVVEIVVLNEKTEQLSRRKTCTVEEIA